MSYKSFNLSELELRFGIRQEVSSFLTTPLPSIRPSNQLLLELKESKELPVPLNTEKAKSEAIVFPILKELMRRNKDNCTLFSGYNLNADASKGLNGECDYIMSRATKILELKAPIFCLTEAKKDNIDEGVGRCAAQMLGARIFNHKSNQSIETIYGCITNTEQWLFLKLEDETIFIEPNRLTFNQLPEILGVFQQIIDIYRTV